MAEVRSAVVLLHDKDNFILEKRPDLPGKLAYAGKLQLLGGHAEEGELAIDAAAREIGEETTLSPEPAALEEVWSGEFEGRDRYDQPITREVSVYALALTRLGSETLRLCEQGELVKVAKTPETIEEYNDIMTPFALAVLQGYVKGEQPRFSE